MKYNRHLANRFVSDYKLPVPITTREDFFYYYLNLLEKDYNALTKWNKLLDTINEQFDGDSDKFLNYYAETREKIINTILENPAYQKFNNMDMSKFAVKDKINVSSNNIYNYENVNKIFLSVDLKKANFQALKYVDPNIVLNCKTYEDFISKITDLYYIKESKYSRQVIFGCCNPKRHITIEKYIINQIRILLDEILQINPNNKDYPLVSMSNDELVYINPIQTMSFLFNEKISYAEVIEDIKRKIHDRLGFDVNIELFMLEGFELFSEESLKVHKTFFNKYNLITDEDKLVCVPLPFFPIAYKLFNRQELNDMDLYFEYEKLIVKLQESLALHIIRNINFDDSYISSVKKKLCCNNKGEDEVTYSYTETEIDNNLFYFKKCYLNGMSAHTALEMFYYYLKEKENE